jgi:methylated-DNA-protein-cysteine methyltransferase-like protein
MSERKPTEFTSNVIASIKKIPRGKVATYSQIAGLAGKPHAARGVSWILNSSTKAHALPWFRVLGSSGRISIPKGSKGFLEQKKHLMKEGVAVAPDGSVDLAKFQWKRKPLPVKELRLTPKMFG